MPVEGSGHVPWIAGGMSELLLLPSQVLQHFPVVRAFALQRDGAGSLLATCSPG